MWWSLRRGRGRRSRSTVPATLGNTPDTRVIGTALAARAAAELETSAGIPSQTIASLLADLDNPNHGGLPPGSVVIVDEAGMVGTRTLARLLDHAAAAHAKVVLVGDPRQLPEIDAGGVLRGLARRVDCPGSAGRARLAPAACVAGCKSRYASHRRQCFAGQQDPSNCRYQ